MAYKLVFYHIAELESLVSLDPNTPASWRQEWWRPRSVSHRRPPSESSCEPEPLQWRGRPRNLRRTQHLLRHHRLLHYLFTTGWDSSVCILRSCRRNARKAWFTVTSPIKRVWSGPQEKRKGKLYGKVYLHILLFSGKSHILYFFEISFIRKPKYLNKKIIRKYNLSC